MPFDLRQLRYFVAVAEERHFGRAADTLRIAQPGLSRQIKRLEEAIGGPLFTRSTREIGLTPAGEVLLPYARILIGITERAVAEAREASEAPTRVLKIGGYALAYYPGVAGLLERFTDRFPDARVEFVPGRSVQSFDALLRGSIDIVLTVFPFDEFSTDAKWNALGRLEALVAVPTGHPLAAKERISRADLYAETVLMWPRELNELLVDHIRSIVFGEQTHPHLVEVAEVFELLMRVSQGEGLGIVNAAVTSFHTSDVEFRELEEPAFFEYGFVWLETSLHPNARLLLDFAFGSEAPRPA